MADAVKLTKAQRDWLEYAATHYQFGPGPKGASSCASLARKGLLVDLYQGAYRISDAGRAALAASKENPNVS